MGFIWKFKYKILNFRLEDKKKILKMISKSLINVFIFFMIGIISLESIEACYITNCPWGGKRSLEEDASSRNQVSNTFNNQLIKFWLFIFNFKCPTCADGLGKCFGPKICCSPDMGCFLDTKETQACQHEDANSSPCVSYGRQCKSVESGLCATKKLCCNAGNYILILFIKNYIGSNK
jgi:hypothetical protein